MANNSNNNFEIPIPLIVVAYIINWPIGVVLTILRLISKSSSSGAKKQESAAEMRSRFEAQRQAELNRQKNDAMQAELDRQRQRANARNQAYRDAVAKDPVTNPYYREQVDKNSAKEAKNSGGYAGLVTGGVIAAIIAGFIMLFAGLAVDSGLSFLAALTPFVLISASFFIGAKLYKDHQVELGRMRKMIGSKESYNLSKLASASGKSLKKVRKQLQKMIDKGEFGESAYIDLGSNNFMRHPDAEPDNPEGFDYRTVYGDLFAKKKAKEGQKEEEAPEVPEDDSDEARFAKIITEIRRLNDEIVDEKVSERIDRIEGHTRHIFNYVTEHPEMMPQIRTFMNYYLPTTLKLLESYSRIEKVGVAGENMKKSKENIESILDLLVVGFEQQVDQLFRNESIDITADISVLETMMAKDGLNGKNDFDLSSYIGEAAAEAEEAGTPMPSEAPAEEETFTDGWTDEIGDGLTGGAIGKEKK